MDVQTRADLDRIRWATTELAVEIPSWGFVNTGTRFRVFPQAGVPRDAFEKVEDAATVARYTGIAKTVALHIPWDNVEDFGALAAFASERGIRIGGINSNTFQDEDYKLGSLTHPVGSHPTEGDRGDHPLLRDRPGDGLRHRQGLAVGRHELSRPGRLPGTPSATDRIADRGLCGPARQRPHAPRVQAVRAGLLPHRRAGLGPVAVGLPAPRRAGPGLRRHRPSRHGGQHRADRRDPAPGGPPGRVRPERQEVRRRRPDGGQHRPVPAVPDLPRAGRGDARRERHRRSRDREPRRVHARSVPQHRAEDPGA